MKYLLPQDVEQLFVLLVFFSRRLTSKQELSGGKYLHQQVTRFPFSGDAAASRCSLPINKLSLLRYTIAVFLGSRHMHISCLPVQVLHPQRVFLLKLCKLRVGYFARVVQ